MADDNNKSDNRLVQGSQSAGKSSDQIFQGFRGIATGKGDSEKLQSAFYQSGDQTEKM